MVLGRWRFEVFQTLATEKVDAYKLKELVNMFSLSANLLDDTLTRSLIIAAHSTS